MADDTAMGFENILVDVEAPIATITLNRPKVLNALSPDLRSAPISSARSTRP
jgi:enoyl-CoA hydratase/carnithine racemase